MGKAKFGISIDPELATWLDGVSHGWNLSRSEFVEIAIRAIREVVGAQIRMTESDKTRALRALETLQAGAVPETFDLEALARWLKQLEMTE
ncbi:MAG: hypothetical protein V3U30_03730 [Thermoplasmata archaeon]